MKNILKLISALIFLSGTAGCDSAGGALVKNTEVTDAPEIIEVRSPVVKESPVYQTGDAATLGDFIIKVNKVLPFEPTDEFMRLQSDKQLIAVEVEYNNHTAGNKIMSNPLDWTASDNEGFSYDYDLMMAKEPLLNRKILNAGGKVKGWITFQIPKTNKLVSLQFRPDLLENENVEFILK